MNGTYNIAKEIKTDVVIIGGGLAGCSAAIACARAGSKALLIEQGGCLGGLATVGHVSPMSAIETTDGTSFGGIMQEIADELRTANINYCGSDQDTLVCPSVLRHILLKKVLESKSEILFHAVLVDSRVAKNKNITSVIVYTKSGFVEIFAKAFIDASGDGDLIALSGAEWVYGSEPGVFSELVKTGLDQIHFEDKSSGKYENYQSGKVQPVSSMFTMGDVDIKKASVYINKMLTFKDLGITKEIFNNLEYAGTVGFEDNGDLIPLPQGRVLFFEAGRKGQVVVNMSRVIEVNTVDAFELSRAETIVQMQVLYLIDFLRKFVPGFENSYFIDSSSTIGVRESRRLVGRYVLRGSDAINCKVFEDAVSYGSYIIDIHDPNGKMKAIGGSIKGKCYGIPYRCLVAKNIDNLIACGRNISADHIAHASTRIQGTCLQTGQAAGTAAANVAKNNIAFKDVDVTALRKILKNNGMYIE